MAGVILFSGILVVSFMVKERTPSRNYTVDENGKETRVKDKLEKDDVSDDEVLQLPADQVLKAKDKSKFGQIHTIWK